MSFEIPTADRTRLDQLLEVLGDRADDFKKCFDIESEWCWKYALRNDPTTGKQVWVFVGLPAKQEAA